MPPLRPHAFTSSYNAGESTDAAVDAILAEAADLVALDHIAALNTAHLTASSLLPHHLETRFRKLNTFPASKPIPQKHTQSPEDHEENQPNTLNRSQTIPKEPNTDKNPIPSAKNDAKIGTESQQSPKNSPLPSPPKLKLNQLDSEGGENLSPKVMRKSKCDGGSGSPSGSVDSSPSPPRQRWCFSWSPSRGQRRRVKDEEVLGELGEFSLSKKQQKLKKALRKQVKVMQEAEELVNLAMQASSRMKFGVEAVDELLSDDEEFK